MGSALARALRSQAGVSLCLEPAASGPHFFFGVEGFQGGWSAGRARLAQFWEGQIRGALPGGSGKNSAPRGRELTNHAEERSSKPDRQTGPGGTAAIGSEKHRQRATRNFQGGNLKLHPKPRRVAKPPRARTGPPNRAPKNRAAKLPGLRRARPERRNGTADSALNFSSAGAGPHNGGAAPCGSGMLAPGNRELRARFAGKDFKSGAGSAKLPAARDLPAWSRGSLPAKCVRARSRLAVRPRPRKNSRRSRNRGRG